MTDLNAPSKLMTFFKERRESLRFASHEQDASETHEREKRGMEVYSLRNHKRMMKLLSHRKTSLSDGMEQLSASLYLKISQLPELLSSFYSDRKDIQLDTCRSIKTIISSEEKPPMKLLIDSGLFSVIGSAMKNDHFPELQIEVLWIYTNLTIEDGDDLDSILPIDTAKDMVRLLKLTNQDLVKASTWAIANLSFSQTKYRDMFLSLGAADSLCELFKRPLPSELPTLITSALSSLCVGNPSPPFSVTSPLLPFFARLIHARDVEIVSSSLWGIASITSDTANLEVALAIGWLKNVINLLYHQSIVTATAAASVVCNVSRGDEKMTQLLIKNNTLTALSTVLHTHINQTILTLTCSTLCNIACDGIQNAEKVFEADVVLRMVRLMCGIDLTTNREKREEKRKMAQMKNNVGVCAGKKKNGKEQGSADGAGEENGCDEWDDEEEKEEKQRKQRQQRKMRGKDLEMPMCMQGLYEDSDTDDEGSAEDGEGGEGERGGEGGDGGEGECSGSSSNVRDSRRIKKQIEMQRKDRESDEILLQLRCEAAAGVASLLLTSTSLIRRILLLPPSRYAADPYSVVSMASVAQMALQETQETQETQGMQEIQENQEKEEAQKVQGTSGMSDGYAQRSGQMGYDQQQQQIQQQMGQVNQSAQSMQSMQSMQPIQQSQFPPSSSPFFQPSNSLQPGQMVADASVQQPTPLNQQMNAQFAPPPSLIPPFTTSFTSSAANPSASSSASNFNSFSFSNSSPFQSSSSPSPSPSSGFTSAPHSTSQFTSSSESYPNPYTSSTSSFQPNQISSQNYSVQTQFSGFQSNTPFPSSSSSSSSPFSASSSASSSPSPSLSPSSITTSSVFPSPIPESAAPPPPLPPPIPPPPPPPPPQIPLPSPSLRNPNMFELHPLGFTLVRGFCDLLMTAHQLKHTPLKKIALQAFCALLRFDRIQRGIVEMEKGEERERERGSEREDGEMEKEMEKEMGMGMETEMEMEMDGESRRGRRGSMRSMGREDNREGDGQKEFMLLEELKGKEFCVNESGMEMDATQSDSSKRAKNEEDSEESPYSVNDPYVTTLHPTSIGKYIPPSAFHHSSRSAFSSGNDSSDTHKLFPIVEWIKQVPFDQILLAMDAEKQDEKIEFFLNSAKKLLSNAHTYTEFELDEFCNEEPTFLG